jgi:hypothetical protein
MLTPDTWNQIDGPLRVPLPTMTVETFSELMGAIHVVERAELIDAGIIDRSTSPWISFRFRPVSTFLEMPDEFKRRLFDLLVVKAAS